MIGDEVDLLTDGHRRFNVPTGIKIIRELHPFFEKPTPPENLVTLKSIHNKSPSEKSTAGRIVRKRYENF